ncbi:Asp-tRNA(Asn)/Glu-tRNA(Gln) amidotransferase subunit GatC [Mesorhizobium japonicum]|uniref:Asp-tRNA(Asn)/Glu-tRNA(Gln) amidotransferase subunit GatC n=1 Tax=Mesorhizobium japonicum TaxID=2066070 RepID=UPI003B5B7701
MSEITPDVVRHVASLARIGLDEQEVERLTGQLGAIVDAVATVQEVATPDVPATSHPIPLGTVTRADVPGATLTPDQALAAAPERDGDFFKVSSILGEEQ